jgi:hypothetical protein
LEKVEHAVSDAAEAVAEATVEATHDAAEVADAATTGIPQWMWIAGAAVVIVGLLMFLT